jgi:hypothetical protein
MIEVGLCGELIRKALTVSPVASSWCSWKIGPQPAVSTALSHSFASPT